MENEQQEQATTVSSRKRNLAFDALVLETQANPHFGDGQIAKALQAIKAAAFHEGILEEDLHVEIGLRAEMYRNRWPSWELTPTALAKHWLRVAAPRDTRSAQEMALERLRSEG